MPDHHLHPIAIEIHIYAALLLKFFNQALEERLRGYDTKISALQHSILRMLQYDTLTISEISRRMGLDPSTLVRAVDALERKDLARRGTDPHDRRRNPITITPNGLELVSAVPSIDPADPTFLALQSLGAESSTHLRDLLRRLILEFPEGKLVADLMAKGMEQP
jgi:DNA-binding MarR family transcriptional regulator